MLRKTLSRVASATAREVCGHLVPRKKARSASYGAQHQLVGWLYLVASSELSFTRTARGKTVLGGGVVQVDCSPTVAHFFIRSGYASTTARSVGMREFWFRAQLCLVSSNAGNGRGKTVLVASG